MNKSNKKRGEFKALFSLIWRYKHRLVIGLLAIFVVDGTQLILPLIIRRAVDILALGKATGLILAKYAFYIVALALVAAALRFVWRYFIIGTSRKIEEYLRNKLFSHIQTLSATFFGRIRTGDLMARATNDIEAVRRATAMGVFISVDSLILLIFSLGAMISISTCLAPDNFWPKDSSAIRESSGGLFGPYGKRKGKPEWDKGDQGLCSGKGRN